MYKWVYSNSIPCELNSITVNTHKIEGETQWEKDGEKFLFNDIIFLNFTILFICTFICGSLSITNTIKQANQIWSKYKSIKIVRYYMIE